MAAGPASRSGSAAPGRRGGRGENRAAALTITSDLLQYSGSVAQMYDRSSVSSAKIAKGLAQRDTDKRPDRPNQTKQYCTRAAALGSRPLAPVVPPLNRYVIL